MPTVKMQDEFFVTFVSAKDNIHTWTPTDINKRGIFTLKQLKKRAVETAGQMIEASYGREDWGFTIHKANYGLISDPALYKHGVAEYGYTKGEEVFKFD